MIIRGLFYDNLGIARAIIQSKDKVYDTAFDIERKMGWCSCASYVFNKKPCKHIIHLIMNVDKNKMKKKSDLNRLKSGCEIIDDLLGGGIPYGIVTGIHGKPMAGKSIFTYQIGVANLNESADKTLYIDTEGIREDDIRGLLYKFGERFDVSKETIDKRFDIITTLGDSTLKSYQKLFKMFGVMAKIEQSSGGKYTPKFEFSAPILDKKKLEQYSMIIIDSFSKPMKDSVGTNTANLPARSQLQERLFGIISHIAVEYNIAIIINHHTSRNPTMPFGVDFGQPIGGDSIIYNTKYVLEFWDATNKIKKDSGFELEARRVKLIRHPVKQLDNEWRVVRLKNDYGYTDE